MFFNENGVLDIDAMVSENESFKKIMNDGIITEEEVKEQSDRVVGILKNMETEFSADQIDKVKQLLVETGVLYAVYNFYSLQNIDR